MLVSFGEFQAKLSRHEGVELRYPIEDVPNNIIIMAEELRRMGRESLSEGWTLDDIAELALGMEGLESER